MTAQGATDYYLEDQSLSLTQNIPSLAVNVTAIQQCGTNLSGPLYTLYGKTDSGYWYAVGIGSNWPTSLSPLSPSIGFQADINVHSANSVVFNSRTNLASVQDGDNVQLKLAISGSNVTMSVEDLRSSQTHQETYSSFGSTEFLGNTNVPVDSNGFYTGLATRQYYDSPYYGEQRKVTYTWSSAISSAWMRIVEFPYPSRATTTFDSYGLYQYTNPTAMQNFSANGATETSSSNTFVTGKQSTGYECPVARVPFLPLSLPPYWYILLPATAGLAVAGIALLVRRRQKYEPRLTPTIGPAIAPNLTLCNYCNGYNVPGAPTCRHCGAKLS